MESIHEILRNYHFTEDDNRNRRELADLLLPDTERLADDFYEYLREDPHTASYFQTKAQVKRRKETLSAWFTELLTASYDNRYLNRLRRVGKVHVKIGLNGHFVNAAMHFVRDFCHQSAAAHVAEPARLEALLATLNKILDMNLDVLTSSYREEELKNVFLSRRVESLLVNWAERLLHGLNLLLMLGLLTMTVGVVALFAYDVFHAFATDLEHGVIKALGSLLILWMMIELLHAEVRHLKGGHFPVRIFLELGLVAFLRKIFVATVGEKDPVGLGLLLAGLLTLGVIHYLSGKSERQ
jgi:uncharacterized membrane protein (DUF373 family)/truncated hemoglobin YjbI